MTKVGPGTFTGSVAGGNRNSASVGLVVSFDQTWVCATLAGAGVMSGHYLLDLVLVAVPEATADGGCP